MDKFEYNEQTIYVPTCWEDIALGVFENIYDEKPKGARENIEYVAKVCGVDHSLLLSWSSEIFNMIVDRLAFLEVAPAYEKSQKLEIDGATYFVNTEDKITLAEWVDIEEMQKADKNDISSVLAVVFRPVNEEYDPDKTEARAAMFKAIPVTKVLPVIAFFLHYNRALEQRTRALSKAAEIVDQFRTLGVSFLTVGAGTTLSTRWQTVKYLITMRYYRYLLAKYIRTLYSEKTKKSPKAKTVNFGKP